MNRKEGIRCAIAGLGRIGVSLEEDPLREKPASHYGAVKYNREAQLVAGADPDEEKRAAFLHLEPECRVYEDPSGMMDAEKPDILHIASDTETHMILLKEALSRSIPVIVCEKPLSNSFEEAAALLDAASSSESQILINHERRFSRDYREVRGLIREKAFGGLKCINTRLYMGRTRPAAEILYHDGTHMIDIIRFLTDRDLVITHSSGEPYEKGGQLVVLARAGDTLVHMDFSGGRDHLVFELDLSFERGRIRVGNGVYELWTSEESPYYTGFRSLSCKSSGWTGRTGYFANMMNHALELYRNPGRQSESSFLDGLRVLELIDDILAPYRAETPSSSGV